jgi:hypothetical protein
MQQEKPDISVGYEKEIHLVAMPDILWVSWGYTQFVLGTVNDCEQYDQKKS